jgi:beta-lactamase regulating signal transducer with metallopeptidase domain
VSNKVIHTTTTTRHYFLSWLNELVPQLEYAFPVLVAIYIAGIFFFASRFSYTFFNTRTLRRKGTSQPSNEALDMLYEWKERLNISQRVRLLFSEYVNVPMMIGAVKPVILVPLAMASQLSPDQFEAILLHELAHIKRRDYLVNMIQVCIETIMFFNPFIWRISSIIRREREHCCDDMVIAHTTQPLSYAKALAALETMRLNPLAMAATGNQNQLLNRIKRMMEMRKENFGNSMIPAFILLAGLSVSLLLLSPAMAQSKKEKEKEKKEAAATKKSGGKINSAEIVVVDDNGQRKSYKSIDELPKEQQEKVKEMLGDVDVTANNVEINIDEKEIKEAMAEAKQALKEANIEKEVQEAMKEVDWKKINKEIELAMAESGKAIAMSGKAIAAINWDSLGHVISTAVKSSNDAVKAINWDSLSNEISISIDSAINGKKKVKVVTGGNVVVFNADDDGKKTSSVYSSAHGPNTVTVSAGSYEKMLAKMEKQGLINRSEPYKVEKKKGKLYINGDLQPADVYNKYKNYLDAEKLTISGDGNNININVKK